MTHESSILAGLILAGGQGRRWGGPKAAAVLPDGRTFLTACTQTLIDAGVAPVAATLPPGLSYQGPAVLEALPLPAPDLDMFASLRHGLSFLLQLDHWSAVVMLPVDHPLVLPSTVATLVAAGPPAARPRLDGRHGHPICLWRACAAHIVTTTTETNLRQVLRRVGAADVEVDDPGVRANCNTPDALAHALRTLELRQPDQT